MASGQKRARAQDSTVRCPQPLLTESLTKNGLSNKEMHFTYKEILTQESPELVHLVTKHRLSFFPSSHFAILIQYIVKTSLMIDPLTWD